MKHQQDGSVAQAIERAAEQLGYHHLNRMEEAIRESGQAIREGLFAVTEALNNVANAIADHK